MSDEHEARFERIACRVCGKPVGMAAADCHRLLGQRNPLCRDHERCRIHEKTVEQFEYVLTPPDRNVFLRACPGSGKTEAVGLKAAYEKRLWSHPCGGLAVLTFTNAAAETIRTRVRQFTGESLAHPHYVDTLDSWLHRYIANPFGHHVTGYAGKEGSTDRSIRVVGHEAKADWLAHYASRTNYYWKDSQDRLRTLPIHANRIQPLLDGPGFEFLPLSESGENWLSDEAYYASPAFDEWRTDKAWLTKDRLREHLRDAKRRFWRSGFVTHRDVEYICCKLLAELPRLAASLARRFPVIIIDECQDLSPTQLTMLGSLLANGANLQLVGDLCQAIYSFRKVEPAKVAAFAKEHGFRSPTLSANFRSYQSIVNVCSGLPVDACGIQGREDPDDSLRTCVCFGYSKGGEPALAERFVAYLRERDIPLGRCAIVARGQSTVTRLRGHGPADATVPEELAQAIYLWQNGNPEMRIQALAATGKCVAPRFFAGDAPDTRAHSFSRPRDRFSPAHWRNILARVLDGLCRVGELRDIQQDWKTWVHAANAALPRIVSESCGLELSMKAMRSPSKKADCSVLSDLCTAPSAPPIRVTTIHDVKGETLEAVLLVSAQQSKGTGGHWTEWIRPDGDHEHARFAYVASSRPRSLLAWAIPNPSTQDIATLTKLGFSFLDGTSSGAPDTTSNQNLRFDI